MFNFISFKRIDFLSNPPLFDQPVVKAVENSDGNISNKVVFEPKSNRSFFDGIHFSYEMMSLRAKLNLGVKLTKVPNVNINNDPAVVLHQMENVGRQFDARIAEIEMENTFENSKTD